MALISTSILSANFANLKEEIEKIKSTDMIHIDVMDGIFVPNLTFGQIVMKAIKDILKELNLKILFDVHLMVISPLNYIEKFYEIGADSITFHYESYRSIEMCIKNLKFIKNFGINAGIAINPETYLPKNELNTLLRRGKPDILLIMGVHPGYGGQKFINDVFLKIKKTKKMIDKENLNIKIAVDGGINFQNVDKIIKNGADIVVIGSEIFKGDPEENLFKIRSRFLK